MSKDLKPYKGYIGQVEIDEGTGMLSGEVINLKDGIAFEGRTVEEAVASFHRAVDAYLDFCERNNLDPDRPLSGNIPFRTTPEHHRMIFTAARLAKKSVNAWMDGILAEAAKKAIGASTRELV